MLFQVDTDPHLTIVHVVFMGQKRETHREEFTIAIDELLRRRPPVVIVCLQRAHPGAEVAAKRLAKMVSICKGKYGYSWNHLLVIPDQRDRAVFQLAALQENLPHHMFDNWESLQRALPQFLNITPSSSSAR